tara:strand:+ start:55 stop:3252 length:3198 start_codon:yes stop_codon:yes gene_type:complete
MAVSKGRALSATVNSATSLIKSSIDGTVTTSTLEQSAQQYANAAALPSVGNTFGEMALVQSTNRMYVWNGTGWYNVALINTNPVFTTSPAASYEFDADSPRNNITITVAADDPESLGVSFSFETGGSMDSMATVTQDSSVFTLVPKGNDSLTDGVTLTGSLTIKATDGVNIVPAVSSFTLTFVTIIQNTAETQLLMKATGTGNNSTYDDKSTSNHTLTAYGQIEQMAFSPYRESGYSMSFDGTGDYLQIADNADFDLAGEFAYEFWLYRTGSTSGTYQAILGSNGSGSNGLTFYITQSNGALSIFQSSFIISGSAGNISDNKWHHVLLMRDSSNLLQLFIDGNRVHSSTNNTAFTDNSGGSGTRIGYDISANGYFKGFLTDIRLIKGSTGEYSSGTSITVPTERLTAITNTKLLIGGNGFRDASTSNHTLTRNGNTFMAAFAPYDISGAYTTATRGGSVLLAPQGGNDYFTATSADFAFGTGDFTVEVWVYPLNVSVHQMIMDTVTPGATGGTAGRIVLYLNPNKMAVYTPGGTVTASGSQTVTVGQWHHLAWVRNSGTLKMYMDGEETHSYSNTYNYSLQTLTLGRDAASGGAGQARAIWSDLRIVKGTAVYTSAFDPPTAPLTAITNTKLLLPFTDAKIFDASQGVGPTAGEVQTIVTIGDGAVASSGQQHFGENTIFFDGSNDYIDINQPIRGLEDHTHEAWVYPTAGHSSYKGFFASAPDGSGSGINVSKDVAGGPNNSSPAIASFNPTVPDNEWSHVVLQRQSGIHSLYRNGVLQGTSSATVNFDQDTVRMASRYRNTTTYGFGGYIHDFRISKGLARFPYIAKPVTLTQTNSGMEKPDGTTPTATASNTLLLTCHAASITDGSSNSTSITANGNAAVSDFGPASGMKSVYFDGTGDYLSLTTASALGTGSWTIEYWVYHNSIASNGTHINFGGDADYTPNFYFITTFDGFKVFHTGTMSNHSYSGSHVNALDSGRIVANKWYHAAYSHDDSTGKLSAFTNGSLTAEASYNGNISSTAVRIGGTTLYNHMLNGYISNLRIVKGQALYPSNFTPVTTALSG